MYYVLRMHVIQSEQKLKDKSFDPCFTELISEASLIFEVRFKIALVAVVKEDTEKVIRLEMVLEPNDVWMANSTHHLHFLHLVIKIAGIIGIYLNLFHDHNFAIDCVSHFVGSSEGTLAQLYYRLKF
jgi:hypothetical protein